MISLICALVLSQPSERRVLPVQADLSVQGALTSGSRAGGALYFGTAFGPVKPPWGTPFFGAGLEVVYSTSGEPYSLSYGAQLRAGYAWSREAEDAQTRAHEVMPDALVYARVTPFLTGDVSAQERSMTARTVLPGVRLGVGITAPWWTRQLLFSRPFANERGFLGQTLQVLSGLVFGPVALLNHAELMVELSPVRSGAVSVLVRLGTGF